MERILVIHDGPGSAWTVRRILVLAGYGVITVPCGPNAMDAFHNTNPALVVLDVCGDGKSGQDLCRQIRAKSERVPILVLSTADDVGDVILLLELGADGYITKPFNPGEFLARVRAAMRNVIY